MVSKDSEIKDQKDKFNKESFKNSLQIFSYIKPYKWKFIFGMFLLFLSSMVFMVFPYLSGEMIDIAQGKSNLGFDLKGIAWILVIVLLIQGFVSYTRVILFAQVSEKGIRDLRKSLYDKLIILPLVFFEENRVGELISRLTSDVERLDRVFSITLAEFFRQIIILIVGVIFIAFTTPRLAGVMLLTFPIIVVGGFFFGKYIRNLSKQKQKQLAESNIIVSETSQSIQTVKSFTNEKFESNRYRKSLDILVEIALKFAAGRASFSVFIVTVLFGALFFIIWQGAVMLEAGTITAGELVSFVFYTGIIGASIASLGNFVTELLGAIGATERLMEILDMEPELSYEQMDDAPAKIYGNIEYKNVVFAYPTRPDIKVLQGLNLSIQAGQKIALVGASGAGKSTIIQLLQRFYDLESGDIKVDDKSIFDYGVSEYRNNLGIVPQDVILFGGSIKENLLYGKPDASEAELIEAAKISNSWEFISRFPERLETIVGERGVKLSGGQKQRIAIARAVLRNPTILLLDEATSSLDAESESLIQEALNRLMEGRTSIIIAHRLSTIRDVDQIYVIGDGKIIEQGTHLELTAIEDGAYNTLAKLQFESKKL